MAAWVPDATTLQQVAHMLTCSLSNDNRLQQEARVAMEAHSAHPEFVRYLLVLFSRGPQLGLPSGTRHSAGVALKRIVDRGFAMLAPEAQDLLKAEVASCLSDANPDVRRTAANVIAAVVRDADLVSWKTLPGALHATMVSGSLDALLGAILCLEYLSDDVAAQFDAAVLGHPLNAIVPSLIECLRHSSLPVRLGAARCMNNFLVCRASAVAAHMQPYLASLAALAADPSPDVRRLVCKSFATLAETNIALIWRESRGVGAVYGMPCVRSPPALPPLVFALLQPRSAPSWSTRLPAWGPPRPTSSSRRATSGTSSRTSWATTITPSP